MAEEKNQPKTGNTNSEAYLEKSRQSYEKEMALFEQFYKNISHRADTHRQITVNNVNEVEKRLTSLKEEADKLRDSIFYHDETVIVDRQEIIAKTEDDVHQNNSLLLANDRYDAENLVSTVDYMNKALIQVKLDFFDAYNNSYLKSIVANDDFTALFEAKSETFQKVLDKHQKNVMSIFLDLNEEIREMDDKIARIMHEKNDTISSIVQFYDQESKNYVDNQLMFSPASDPTSIDIQALVSDKINQFHTFRRHLEEQTANVEKHIVGNFTDLDHQIVGKMEKHIGNTMLNNSDFFNSPEDYLTQMKKDIVKADESGDKEKSARLLEIYMKAKDYEKYRTDCQKRATRMLKKHRETRKEILTEYILESNRTVNNLERTLKLYQELMQYDTFLAQAVGDDSSNVIKDELNYLSLLSANKEFKANINFDIESQTLKDTINEVEGKLVYQVKKELSLQEKELLDVITDLQNFLYDRKAECFESRKSVEKERLLIDRMQEAMNCHLEHMHNMASLNRRWDSEVLEILVHDIRQGETHDIKVVDAAAKIRLALKEYDIKALHFKTMYENELSYLVMQSSRVSEENEIHNDFVVTTLENQMRFTKEQIDLANSEYEMRVDAIIRAVNEERNYVEQIYANQAERYQKKLKIMDDAYQANLYHNNHLLTETEDQKIHKILGKELDKIKRQYLDEKNSVLVAMENDVVMANAKKRLRELDDKLEDAMDDAKILRDNTITEMSEQYAYAKDRIEAIKPYLDNKVNILDPTFYGSMQSINQRYRHNLKNAESELDTATKQLIADYVVVYNSMRPEPSNPELRQKMSELVGTRERLNQEYSLKMQSIENDFNKSSQEYDNQIRLFREKVDADKALLLNKHQQVKQRISNDLAQIDIGYLGFQKKQITQHENSIRHLTEEYQEAKNASQVLRENLSLEFGHLLSSYKPYIRLLKKDRDIRDVFSEVNRKARKKLHSEQKEIKKRMRITKLIP
ncbi:MAG TPA: hypothetical protein PLP02_02940 [Bacillota bacterium]|nr:hypothetical protein [Bacillota bacterium]HPF42441.1 hypothetical protein [Bacillota bacterium]HPJ85699.1 hypothetical protein [Bacillota bacterium]